MFENTNTEKKLNIGEVLFIVRRNFKLIIISIFISLILVGGFGGLTLPTYNASSTILIEDISNKQNALFDIAVGRDRNMISNQIEIIKSDKIISLAVDRLYENHQDEGMYLFETRDENFDIHNLPRQSLRKVFLLEKPFFENLEESAKFYGSENALKRKALRQIKNDIIIKNARDSEIIQIEYSTYNSEEAASIVNAIIESYILQDINWENDEHAYLQRFLTKQLNETKNELSIIENSLKDFQEKNKIFAVDENSRILLEKLQLAESNYYETSTELNIENEKENYFLNKLSIEEKRFAEKLINTIDSKLISLREELANLEAEFASAKSKNSSNNLAVKNIELKISSLKETIKDETQVLIKQGFRASNPIEFRQSLIDQLIEINANQSSLSTQKQELDKVVKIYSEKIENLPAQFLTLSKLQRDKVILDATYSLMKRKYEESRIAEASELGKVKVIDTASSNILSNWPPGLAFLFLASIAMVIMLSTLMILIREMFFDLVIRNFEFVEDKGISILGLIPQFEKDLENERQLFMLEKSKSPIAESYRSIRTSLNFIFDTKYKKTNEANSLIISSSGPQEGKSTTAANIAASFAKLGKKSLIIDFDMRKPVLHKLFHLDKSVGFTSLFLGKTTFNNSISKTEVKNLYALPCGPIPPNPSEILESKKTLEIINKLKKDFDIIVVDTPPIIAVTDSVQVLRYFDDILLVVRASKTQKGAFERSLKSIQQSGHELKHCIFNDVSNETSYGGQYYYNYYQYYYGESNKKS